MAENKNQKIVKNALHHFSRGKWAQKKQPERYAILQELYDSEEHFDIGITLYHL